jgi:hypothetical protein
VQQFIEREIREDYAKIVEAIAKKRGGQHLVEKVGSREYVASPTPSLFSSKLGARLW